METEIIYGQVVSKANNYAIGDGASGKHIVKSSRLKAYERSFAKQCRIYKDRLINKHFALYIKVYEESRRYDLDNALKTILDCLQHVRAITDDNLCLKIVAVKAIDRQNPRVEFGIEEYEPSLFA